MLRGLRIAGSFLTRVPMHVEGEIDLPGATPWFPAVGVGVGVAAALVWAGAAQILPAAPAAALALVVAALITGAFHHDGIGDIADAFGGGWTVEQRLAILKDSRHGTYGVTSIVFVVLVQWSSLASVPVALGAAGLVGANVVGRAAILGVLLFGRSAHQPGLGTDHSEGLSRARCTVGLVLGCVAAPLLVGPWGLVVLGAPAVSGLAVHELARRKIGGFTGDVLGATEISTEALVLVVVAALGKHGITPWWA
jgi:adenosylcobinamide-GDP ribazoletransferase